MILLIDKTKQKKEEKYNLFYRRKDIPENLLGNNTEIIEIDPITIIKPTENFKSFYDGC